MPEDANEIFAGLFSAWLEKHPYLNWIGIDTETLRLIASRWFLEGANYQAEQEIARLEEKRVLLSCIGGY